MNKPEKRLLEEKYKKICQDKIKEIQKQIHLQQLDGTYDPSNFTSYKENIEKTCNEMLLKEIQKITEQENLETEESVRKNVENYLNCKKIRYEKVESNTTQSIYYNIYDSENLKSCIRVSNHKKKEEQTFLVDLIYSEFYTQPKSEIKKLIEQRIEKGLRNRVKKKMYDIFAELDGKQNR